MKMLYQWPVVLVLATAFVGFVGCLLAAFCMWNTSVGKTPSWGFLVQASAAFLSAMGTSLAVWVALTGPEKAERRKFDAELHTARSMACTVVSSSVNSRRGSLPDHPKQVSEDLRVKTNASVTVFTRLDFGYKPQIATYLTNIISAATLLRGDIDAAYDKNALPTTSAAKSEGDFYYDRMSLMIVSLDAIDEVVKPQSSECCIDEEARTDIKKFIDKLPSANRRNALVIGPARC